MPLSHPHIVAGVGLLACLVGLSRASACDCEPWQAADVYQRSSLLFVARAGPFDWQRHQQGFEVIATLKGQTQTNGTHVIDFGDDMDDCKFLASEGDVVLLAITDRSAVPNYCDGSGSVMGHRDDLEELLELSGARPTTLSGPAIVALLTPALAGGHGAAWFVGPGPRGETIDVTGRDVHVVDAIDGTPAGEVFNTSKVIQLRDVIYIELAGEVIPDAQILLRVPTGGDPELLFAFWKGGRIRIPEPK